MSSEFITLTREDPEFESYLLGTFSDKERAIPVETYHAQTYRERVTFRIVPIDKLSAPPWWTIYFWSCRPELLALTLGPSFAAWLNHPSSLSAWERWPSWLALVGIFFLHTAAFLYNDVQDHVHGADRLNRRRGSQVIQKGWSSAAAMKKWALVNLGLAVLFGLPAFMSAPVALAGVCLTAFLALTVVMKNWGSRWGLCDLALLLLFGPLLTMGIALASFGETNLQDVALGVAFGAMTVWVFQVRQFEDLFRSKPENFRTFLGRLNFDKARLACVVEGFILLGLHPSVGVMVRVPLLFLMILPLVSIPSILLMNRLFKAASPLSSSLVGSSRWALLSHLAWTLWWLAALGTAWL
ncbi:MAG: UbiA family prenyltransferase [Bdellovibrionales bacterium]|nr:UbiA family prenyltransferase [Bdellovibrionales bacterium]